MGISSDAYLFWGFYDTEENDWINFGKNHQDPDYVELDYDGDDDDWEDAYVKRMGLKNEESWNAKHKLIQDCGCEIGSYCSIDVSIPFVAISDSLVCVSFDCCVIKSLQIKSDWERKLREFCKIMEIKWSEPEWCLASWMG